MAKVSDDRVDEIRDWFWGNRNNLDPAFCMVEDLFVAMDQLTEGHETYENETITSLEADIDKLEHQLSKGIIEQSMMALRDRIADLEEQLAESENHRSELLPA